jgi:putative transposase
VHNYKLKDVYLQSGITRQGHHDALMRQKRELALVPCYLGFILEIRQMHPGMGLRSIYDDYQPQGIGRDAFIEIGKAGGLMLEQRKTPHRTTYASPFARYPNLTKDKVFTDVNQIWSSDITYYSFKGKFYYIVLIMDVFSRKIIGYSIADNMRAINNLNALKMAIKSRNITHFQHKLIHHSDRGSQYISNEYTQTLHKMGILISMCNSVYENTHIERVNGTIKNQYLSFWDAKNDKQLENNLHKAVNNYNLRPHDSLDGMSPNFFEQHFNELPLKEKYFLSIFTDNNSSISKQLILAFDK